MFPDLSFKALYREWSTRVGDQPYRRSLGLRLITAHEELLSATFKRLVEIPESLRYKCSEAVDDALSSLTPREQRVIRLRFGLDDGRWHTLREIGRDFYLSGERIRQIEAKALRKLRHPVRAKWLLMPLLMQRQLEMKATQVLDHFLEAFGRPPHAASG